MRQARIARHNELIAIYERPKQEIYAALITQGYYLPPMNNPAVTREYLRMVKRGEVDTAMTDTVQDYTGIKVDRYLAYCILTRCAKKPLGFDISKLPPKRWMLNMACTLNPHCEDFITTGQKRRLMRDHVNAIDRVAALKILYQNLPEINTLRIKYKPVARTHLQQAILTRLKALAKQYSFVTVNIRHELLN